MSQSLQPRIPPATAADLPEWWITQVREIIERDGLAVRAGERALTIEIQNVLTGAWQPLNLQTNTAIFATAEDRVVILTQLIGRKAK